jgi:hypothetical protein
MFGGTGKTARRQRRSRGWPAVEVITRSVGGGGDRRWQGSKELVG